MASNTHHCSSEIATARKGDGKHDVDAATLLASRVDALAQRLDKIWTSPTPGSSVISVGIYTVCENCGVQGHTSVECYNGPSSIKHANAFHSFNLAQNNPYSNTYNHGWKNHTNSP